jgi:hypothetical protein
MVLSTSSLILPNDQTGQMFFNEVIQQDTHGFTTGLAYDRAGGSEKSAQRVRHARRLPAFEKESLRAAMALGLCRFRLQLLYPGQHFSAHLVLWIIGY